MITVAGGDSHIWGSELSDSPHGGPDGYSRNTFTALLAENNYICAAYPGIGNKEILRRVIDACEQLIYSDIKHSVVVLWTWPGRDNKINSNNEILELQDFLELHSIPYLFTCADNCVITGKLDYTNWFLFPPATEEWNTTTPRGFYQWAVENKYECGPEHHPLERAHRDAANLMKAKIGRAHV